MNKTQIIVIFFSTLMSAGFALAEPSDKKNTSCPEYLDQDYRKLQSSKTVNLCDLKQQGPLLIVNSASHCGYSGQYSELEDLYQKYKDQGLQVVAFTSDDFYQETNDEEKSAEICFVNYGVTFTVLAPTHVKKSKANTTFQYLNSQTTPPKWNFNKYLVSTNGLDIKHYGSSMDPLADQLETDITAMLINE